MVSKFWESEEPTLGEPKCAKAAEIKQMLNNPVLKAPSEDVLKRILAAGSGEHQDRLFTIACKQQVEDFMHRVIFLIEEHAQHHKGDPAFAEDSKRVKEALSNLFN